MLTQRYASQMHGVLSCFDRILITGTLPDICHARAFTRELKRRQVRIFDFTQFTQPLRDAIRKNAEALAAQHGLEIEFIRQIDAFRKEDRVQQILAARGDHPGLVHIFSAMESCSSFRPWHDKASGQTFLKPDSGRCLHYYFYFLDPHLGLCHLRVPTWAPFRLQFCMNGHSWLAQRLKRAGIGFQQVENAFVAIDDFARAQEIADRLNPKLLHRKLESYARLFCPVLREFPSGYHWSLQQLEYATDLVFRRKEDLAPLYEHLVRTAVHAVKAEQVATFLGKKLTGHFQGELGTQFTTRIEGTRIRHQMGRVGLKMYDKFGRVLRIETLCNDVSFFKHHRRVEHRDGTKSRKLAPVKKTIYSLRVLTRILLAANRRYLEFLSSLEDDSAGRKHLEKLSRPVRFESRSYRGINFFDPEERRLFLTLARGEFNLRGLQVRDLRRFLPERTGPQLSRHLKRLRLHGLVKKVRGTYKYYLTRLGRRVTAAALRLREETLIPSLAGVPA